MSSPPEDLPEFILRQVTKTPDKLALTGAQHQSMTYAQMERRSRQWCLAILDAGVKPGQFIGLALNRSPDLVCALLGILRAGCGYVPLDLKYPAQWLKFVIHDSQLTALVCADGSDFQSCMPDTCKVIPPSHLPTIGQSYSATALPRLHADSIAYVIYTSGSTGLPKGVLIRHRNAMNLVNWASRYYSREELRCVLFSTSICFDLSVFEVMAPLAAGGSVHVVPDALSLSDETPIPSISLINTVPSVMKELVRLQAIPTTVETINLAGEALSASLVESIYRLEHVRRVCNLYGPTETTTYSLCHTVARGEQAPAIGMPITATQVTLIDAQGREVAAGETGEICISGAGVGAGYLNRAEGNTGGFVQAKGVTGTFSAYRTGDFARWREDGQLVFCGRRDEQVKIRGYRVELTHIEAVLKQLLEWEDLAVVIAEDVPHGPLLVAFIVNRTVSDDFIAMCRRDVPRVLPHYMIPAAWKPLEAFPRLANGKVDRSALSRSYAAQSSHKQHLPIEAPGVSAVGLHRLVEERVAQRPDGVAAIFNDQQLSFGELNTRANALAGRLRGLGVGPDLVVGVYFERSLEMLISLLAILKAGGAYLALTPDTPAARLEYMLHDCAVTILLTHTILIDRLPPLPDIHHIICVEEAATESEPAVANLSELTTPENLAYVMYTSGSTGKPKGVALPHQGVVNRLLWMHDTFALSTDDRVLQKTPFNFDVSVWEFFWPLISGATLVIAKPDGHRDAEYLGNLIKHQSITTLHFVPPMLERFLDTSQVRQCQSIRRVFCSGQELLPKLQQRFFSTLPNSELHNLYGPTEASIDVTHWQCDRHSSATRVPLGRAIANTHLYLLDENLKPVAPGVIGELYIAGIGLARGYLNQPELTSNSFISNPFDSTSARMYRTGDLTRLLADGNLEYIGRLDTQVKIRGYRIELGEIECALLACPQVDAAVVRLVDREGANPGTQELAAFLTLHSAIDCSAQLRARLERQLPPYMLPARWVILDAMPLTANGKVDIRQLCSTPRQALPSVAPEQLSGLTVQELTRTIWKHALKLEALGLDDNFFAMGADSFMASAVAQQLSHVLGQPINASMIFEAPTASRLSEHLSASDISSRQMPVTLSQSPGRLTNGQQQLLAYTRLMGPTPALQVGFCLKLRRTVAIREVERCVAALAAHHVVLHARIENDNWVATSHSPSLEVIETAALASEHLADWCINLARRDLDIQGQGAWKVYCLNNGNEVVQLLLVFHHVLIDEYSIERILGDLALLLEGKPLLRAEEVAEPGATPERNDIDWWEQRLRGLPKLDIPIDKLVGESLMPNLRSTRHVVHLQRSAWRQLLRTARECASTPYEVLAAALALVLHKWTARSHVLLGAVYSHRDTALSRELGFQCALLPIHVKLPANADWQQALTLTSRSIRECHGHLNVSTSRLHALVQGLCPNRQLLPVRFGMIKKPGATLDQTWFDAEEIDTGYTESSLSFQVRYDMNQACLYVDGRQELFNEDTLEWLVSQWLATIEQAPRDAAINTFSLPAPEHIHARIAIESIWTRFNQRVEEQPERTAIEEDTCRISYEALKERSLAVAAQLHRSIEPGDAVVIYCKSAIEAVVAIFACLRTGAVFVPVNTNVPVKRLSEIVRIVGARTLLLDAPPDLSSHVQPLVKTLIDTRAGYTVKDEDATFAAYRQIQDEVRPAYVLFTSGSTGVPKGVAQSEAALIHHIESYIRSIDITSLDCLSMIASVGYDAALMDVFAALTVGARLSVRSLATHGLSGIAVWLEQQRITVLHATPSAFRALLKAPLLPTSLSTIRCVVLGGEAARSSDLALFNQHFAATARLINGFGPTESTLALQASFEHGTHCTYPTLPIGLPVDGTQVCLINDQVGDGSMEGEVELRSPWVMLGYINAPSDLAALLIGAPDKRSQHYRTGDIARRLPDGHLLHCGRRDEQVKINGVRIELAEVENALILLEEISQACVLVRQNLNDENVLCGFLIPATSLACDPQNIRRQLHDCLPAGMVPSELTIMEHFPYLANGKVDKAALRARAPVMSQHLELSEFESVIAGYWRDELGLPALPERNKRFFDLGGNSLTSMSVCAVINQAYGLHVNPSALLSNPTLEAFATILQNQPSPLSENIANKSSAFALSHQQVQFWLQHLISGGADNNWILWGARISGTPDRTIVDQALDHIVARHPLLRLCVHDSPAGPQAIIAPAGSVRTLWESVTHLDLPLSVQYLPHSLRCPFALTQGAPIRFAVLLHGGKHYLVLLAHHMVVDAYSCQLILRDFDRTYAHMLGLIPQPVSLPPPPFEDSRRRLETAAQRARDAGAITYWTEHLRHAKTLLDLPLADTHGLVPGTESIRRRVDIDATITSALEQFCSEHSITLSSALISLFAIVLCRYGNDSEVIIGLPVSLRILPSEADVVAPLINTVPIHCELAPSLGFSELCGIVQTRVANALDRAYLPLHELVAAVRPTRQPGRSALYQAVFSLHNDTLQSADPYRTIEPVPTDSGTISGDIALTVERQAHALTFLVDGAKGKLHSKLIERIAAQLPVLLHNLLSAPQASVLHTSMLPPAQRAELTGTLAGSRQPLSGHQTLLDAILGAAMKRGNAWAVRGRHNLTYSELVEQATSLSRRLEQSDVEPGEFVPFMVCELINPAVVELAILMVGAAFVPIDPAWPDTVKDKILTDIQAHVLIEQQESALCLTLLNIKNKAGSAHGHGLQNDSDRPIYAISTSGSTALPKTVVIAHRGILNRFAWMSDFFADGYPVTLQTTPLTFDSAVWQILWPLSLGGTCVLPTRNERFDINEFARVVNDYKVTVVDFVPSVLDALMGQITPSHLAIKHLQALRWIIIGAERLSGMTARRVRSLIPAARIFNLYGPTEATIGCIYHEIIDDHDAYIPIGRPLPNVCAFVVDSQQALVARGAPGELMLLGACVGVGYLGQTSTSGFCDSRLCEHFGEPAYLTGDLVRWNENGLLEFLGRRDSQIKVRGVRVEPAGIEAVLREHCEVRRAAVLIRQDNLCRANDEIVAFVVTQSESADLIESIFAHLRQRLASHSIPSRIMALADFPLRSSGKLDEQKMLALFGAAIPDHAPVTRAPGIHGRVQAIWQAVLGTRLTLGENHTFFEVGGHSLLTLSLQRELNRQFKLDLSVTDLFRHTTISTQTRLIVARQGLATVSALTMD